jgi:hypothetical protein
MMIEARQIEIAAGFGRTVRCVEAKCVGDWAVHPHLDVPGLYVITLLPLGLSLPPDWCSFEIEDHAVQAMLAIARLRNSWSVVTQADLTPDLRDHLKAITARHGAVEGPLGVAVRADHNRFGRKVGTRPNGYGAALG